VGLKEREAFRKYYKDLNELIDILARYPQFIELIPPPKRKNFQPPSPRQGDIVSLAEDPPPPIEKVKALIYRVVYFSPPPSNQMFIQRDKEAIGILASYPHLFTFEIPTIKFPHIVICLTPEWRLAHYILPVLARWAPNHEMDFWEWGAWFNFLTRRLTKEIPFPSLPAKGYWERGEKTQREEEKRERVYVKGWDDILTECRNLGLVLRTEEDIEKIIEEARTRWQGYSI
jgi:hypothetical protein